MSTEPVNTIKFIVVSDNSLIWRREFLKEYFEIVISTESGCKAAIDEAEKIMLNALYEKPHVCICLIIILANQTLRLFSHFVRYRKSHQSVNLKMVVTTHKSHKLITERELYWVDLFIAHSTTVASLYHKRFSSKFKFIHYFININKQMYYYNKELSEKRYIFCGGAKRRDFKSILNAAREIQCNFIFVVPSARHLGYRSKIPPNCTIYENIPYKKYIELMANAAFVIVPLKQGNRMHGITNIVEAQWLGKVVISTKNASVNDYIIHSQNGYLVSPKDIDGYKNAILNLLNDNKLRLLYGKETELAANKYTYDNFLKSFYQCIFNKLNEQTTSLDITKANLQYFLSNLSWTIVNKLQVKKIIYSGYNSFFNAFYKLINNIANKVKYLQ